MRSVWRRTLRENKVFGSANLTSSKIFYAKNLKKLVMLKLCGLSYPFNYLMSITPISMHKVTFLDISGHRHGISHEGFNSIGFSFIKETFAWYEIFKQTIAGIKGVDDFSNII